LWLFQTIDIRLFYDKFPSGAGGLKDLYDHGPQSAFFLVKFWVNFIFLCLKYILKLRTVSQLLSDFCIVRLPSSNNLCTLFFRDVASIFGLRA